MAKSFVLRTLQLLRSVIGIFVSFHEISILAYHSVGDANVDTAVSAKDFEAQLGYLQRKGYSFESLQHVIEWHRGIRPFSQKVIALTFDDGYVDFETTVLPILERFNAPATLFVLGDGAAARQRLGNDIPILEKASVERLRTHRLISIGYHSKTHKNITKLPRDEMIEECKNSFSSEFFAYPGGMHSPDARKIIQSLGYVAAFSLKPELVKRTSDLFVMPRNIVFRNMPLWQLDVRTTKAIDWYRAIRKFFKPYRTQV